MDISGPVTDRFVGVLIALVVYQPRELTQRRDRQPLLGPFSFLNTIVKEAGLSVPSSVGRDCVFLVCAARGELVAAHRDPVITSRLSRRILQDEW